MKLKYNEVYENGNPPYELYQGEDGLWGLVDCKGNKLKAVFKKFDDYTYSCVPWETVGFLPEYGFVLVNWADPDEAWFNFTYGDDRYPRAFTKYLWESPNKSFEEYRAEYKRLLPEDSHWILDAISEVKRVYDIEDDDELYYAIKEFMAMNGHLRSGTVADFNSLFDPIMRDENVDKDMKVALWNAKVEMDHNMRFFEDELNNPVLDKSETQKMCDYEHIRLEMQSNRTRDIISAFALLCYSVKHEDVDSLYAWCLDFLALITGIQEIHVNRDMVEKAVKTVWINEKMLNTRPQTIINEFTNRFKDENITCTEDECRDMASVFIANIDAIINELAYGNRETTNQYIKSITFDLLS